MTKNALNFAQRANGKACMRSEQSVKINNKNTKESCNQNNHPLLNIIVCIRVCVWFVLRVL